MSDQPKKQELPPLDESIVKSVEELGRHMRAQLGPIMAVRYMVANNVLCGLDERERQLLAALSDNERLTDLVRYQRCELFTAGLITAEEYAALAQDSERGQRVARLEGYDALRETLRADNEAKDVRIAELQRTVNAVAGGAAQGLMLHAKFNNAFSAGGQRVRRSVEGLLEEPLTVEYAEHPETGAKVAFYWADPVDALLARIREAIK